MNMLDRDETRREKRVDLGGSINEVGPVRDGAIIAKHIIAIENADRSERKWGRLKNLFRAGSFGLLATKATLGIGAKASELVADLINTDIKTKIPEVGGNWFIPTTVALYGLSRVSRYMQNERFKGAMNGRDAFLAEPLTVTDGNNLAIGAIDTLDGLHESRTILSVLDNPNNPNGTPITFSEFLTNTQPTI